MTENQTRLVVCMGVSGCGKSTLGHALAETLGWTELDADDFHPPENIQRMASGLPLDDGHRVPWMLSITERLRRAADDQENLVIAHSALKSKHRNELRNCGLKTRFIFLDGSFDAIEQRMSHRRGHYMPPRLLASQFEALERPEEEPDVLHLPLPRTPELGLRSALELLGNFAEEDVLS